MESITGRRSFLAALLRGPQRSDRTALALGGLALGTLLVVDVVIAGSAVLTGTFIVAPFISALLGSVWATAVLDVVVLALAAVSPEWHMELDTTEYWARFGGLGAGAAFALVGAWARERSAHNARRFEVLDQIGSVADGSLPLDQTLRRVTESIVPIAADFCMVDVIHDGRVTRAAVRAAGHEDAAAIEDGVRRRHPSLPKWLVEDVPQWRHLPRFLPRMRDEELRRMATDPEDFEFLRGLGLRSSISAPLLARGRNLGALTMVTAWSGRRFGRDDVRFAQILASRVALALDNVGMFSDLESVERRMDAVMAMLDEAVAVHDAAGVLVFANLAAARWLGYESAQELIDAAPDARRSRYELLAEEGVRIPEGDILKGQIGTAPPSERSLVRVVLSPAAEERWAMVVSEAILGPDGELLYTVTTLDDVTDVKRAEFTQRLLAGTGDLLAASIDYRETLARVARLAVPQFADRCTVSIPRDDGILERVAVARARPDPEGTPADLDDVALTNVLRGGKPLRSGLPGGGSALAVPMSAGSRIVGVLAMSNAADRRVLNETDLGIAAEIANRAGVAVANARLATEQAEVARTLQRGLLPPELPDMPGWAAASMYRPAGEVNEVGGDFYDAFEGANGWMVVVGDVIGRGARAATLTALARYTIRTAGILTGDPREALAILNRTLWERADGSLCSVVVLTLPAGERGAVEIVNAGHPPALLLRGGAVEELPHGGPLLGGMESALWTPEPVALADGDQLVLYTDGVTDFRGAYGRFGISRLRAGLEGSDHPTAAVSRIEAELDSFAAAPTTDDAAVVVVQRVLGTASVGRIQPSGVRVVSRH